MRSQITIIKPEIIKWARQRTGLSISAFAEKMKVTPDTVEEWEGGKTALPYSKAKKLASLSLLPFGALFLSNIPNRDLCLPDFRTRYNKSVGKASPELEATVLEMQKRQDWMRGYLKENDASELPWVGSLSIKTPISDSVHKIQNIINADDNNDNTIKGDWEHQFVSLIQKMEDAGIIVVRNGVVGNSNNRHLDVDEFRGFVLVDSYAPLIFINGRDDKNPQMFTLIHELVHLFLGKSGLIGSLDDSSNEIERYCNKVTAEFLVPEQQLRNLWASFSKEEPLEIIIKGLSKFFKVSTYVIIWKCRDAMLISKQDASFLWGEIKSRYESQSKSNKQQGGNFYANLRYRVGYTFARIVISELLDHNISYSEAFDLLQIKKKQTLERLSKDVNMALS